MRISWMTLDFMDQYLNLNDVVCLDNLLIVIFIYILITIIMPNY